MKASFYYFTCTVPLLLLTWAVIKDLRTHEIPDRIWLMLLAWVALSYAVGLQTVDSHSIVQTLTGLAIGLGIAGLIAWLGGFGGGDAKLVIGLGAVLGPLTVLLVFWTALIGGLWTGLMSLAPPHRSAPAHRQQQPSDGTRGRTSAGDGGTEPTSNGGTESIGNDADNPSMSGLPLSPDRESTRQTADHRVATRRARPFAYGPCIALGYVATIATMVVASQVR